MTPTKAVFVLDADVLINANNKYYAQDLCAEFWSHLTDCNRQGTVSSIDKIYDELKGRNDDLHRWAINNKSMFASTHDVRIEQTYGKMVAWVESNQYSPAAKEEFNRAADGWLAAYALVIGAVLVTHEQPAPGSSKHVKLPDICKAFTIPYVDTFTMLRDLGIHLCRV